MYIGFDLPNISVTGTLGYVMSEVEDGKPLSQVVRAAKSLGYTEPGFDVILNFYICSKFVHCILSLLLSMCMHVYIYVQKSFHYWKKLYLSNFFFLNV